MRSATRDCTCSAALALLSTLKKKKSLVISLFQEGQHTLVNAVGIGDDHGNPRLAEDLGQAGDRRDPAVDHIAQEVSRSHRGELVDIPYEQQWQPGGMALSRR